MELAGKPLNIIEKMFLWLYLFSFCLDFRGPAGGSAVQFVFLGASIIAAVGFILVIIRRKPERMSIRLKQITIFWWIYLASTLIVMILEALLQASDVTFDHYIRNIFPFLLCGISLILILMMQTRNIDPRELMLPSIISVLVSALWSYYYATAISGLDVEMIRYQILSPATPFEFAYGLIGTFLLGKFRPLALLALVFAVVFEAISITRTYIITTIFCCSALVYFQVQIASNRSVQYFLRQAMILVGATLLLGITGAVVILIRPNVALAWQYRVSGQGAGAKDITKDTTLVTRLSEATGMWKTTLSDPLYIFFGKGIGGTYRWNPDYSREINSVSGPTGGFPYGDQWSGPDTAWPWFLLSSGFVFGPMVLIFILAGTYVSFIVARTYTRYRHPAVKEMIILPFFSLVAYISQTFTNNPLGYRLAGQNIGIMVGLGFWLYYLCVQKPRAALGQSGELSHQATASPSTQLTS